MSKPRVLVLAAVLCLTAVLLAPTPPARAAEEPTEERGKIVKVERIVRDCDGEDCTDQDGPHRVVFIGEDGEPQELTGEALMWTGKDTGHSMMLHRMMHGRGYLGVGITDLTPELRSHFGVPEEAGIMVSRVEDGSPAAAAGLEVGDVLTAVDGELVRSTAGLVRQIRGREPDSTVELEIWRGGKMQTVSAGIGEREIDEPAIRRIMLDCENGEECEPHHLALGVAGDAKKLHRIMVRCEDGEDCESQHLALGGLGDVAEKLHRIVVRCEDGEDCEEIHIAGAHGQAASFDCGGAEQCKVEIECDDGDCTCVVNGESADCALIPGFEAPGR